MSKVVSCFFRTMECAWGGHRCGCKKNPKKKLALGQQWVEKGNNFVELVHQWRSAFNWSTSGAGRGPFGRQEDEDVPPNDKTSLGVTVNVKTSPPTLAFLSETRVKSCRFLLWLKRLRAQNRNWEAAVSRQREVICLLGRSSFPSAYVGRHWPRRSITSVKKQNNVLLSGLSVYNSSNTGCGVCSVNCNNPHSETLIKYNVLVKKSDRFVVSFFIKMMFRFLRRSFQWPIFGVV